MIIRSAVLEGTVDEAYWGHVRSPDEYCRSSGHRHLSRNYGIRLRRPVETEAGAPAIYMIFDLHFETLDAMHAALASPVRGLVREQIGKAMTGVHGQGLSPRPGGRPRRAWRALTTLITGAGLVGWLTAEAAGRAGR